MIFNKQNLLDDQQVQYTKISSKYFYANNTSL